MPVDVEKCPVCGVAVKKENLKGHYERVHPKRAATLSETRTIERLKPSHSHSTRRILLVVLVTVLLVGIVVIALRPGSQSPSARLSIAANPSAVEIAGPGVLSFNITLTPQGSSASDVVLSVPNKPPGVKVIFQPSTLSLSQNPGFSTVTLVVRPVNEQFFPGTYQMRVVASVGSSNTETTVNLQVLPTPSPSKQFSLSSSLSGWNSTNPTIEVRKGKPFALTAIWDPDSGIHHYLSIYPFETPLAQVSEYSNEYYIRTGFEWSHAGGTPETIAFTSWIAGPLRYYCDTHAGTMSGVINITD